MDYHSTEMLLLELDSEAGQLFRSFQAPTKPPPSQPPKPAVKQVMAPNMTEDELLSIYSCPDLFLDNYIQGTPSEYATVMTEDTLDDSVSIAGIDKHEANSCSDVSNIATVSIPLLTPRHQPCNMDDAVNPHGKPCTSFHHWTDTRANRAQAIQKYRLKKAIKHGLIVLDGDNSNHGYLPPVNLPRVRPAKYTLRAQAASRRPRISGRFIRKDEKSEHAVQDRTNLQS